VLFNVCGRRRLGHVYDVNVSYRHVSQFLCAVFVSLYWPVFSNMSEQRSLYERHKQRRLLQQYRGKYTVRSAAATIAEIFAAIGCSQARSQELFFEGLEKDKFGGSCSPVATCLVDKQRCLSKANTFVCALL